MKNTINDRKLEHIEIISSNKKVDKSLEFNHFDKIKLTHRALPEVDFKEIDVSTKFLGYKISMPLIISSMTGGDNDTLIKINNNLSIAASETKVAFAVGSQRVMKHNSNAKKSFDIKNHTSNIPVISNIGAVQLNYEIGEKDIKKFIEFIGAEAIYLHCNPLQEAIQTEGNTNFKGLAKKIENLTKKIEVPIIIKEVGCGLSKYDIALGIKSGVKYFDVAGFGGTSWSLIEHIRKNKNNTLDNLGYLFQNWGIDSVSALIDAQQYKSDTYFITSGGIRNGIDIAKSIILGSSMVGIANPFLEAAYKSPQEVIKIIERLKKELKLTMFLLGVKNIKQLFDNRNLIYKIIL